MISVLATIELAEGRRDDFLAEFRELVPKVRAEDGCIEYAPWIDIATEIAAQPELRSSTVVVIEKWESLDALQAHLMAPHMMEYRKTVKSMVAGTALQILEPA